MDNKLLLIKNIQIYTENNEVKKGSILIEGSKISKISLEGNNTQSFEAVRTLDGNNLNAIPGFIDTHIHGAKGADIMDATPEALNIIASALPAEGTTSFLATTITQSPERIERALKNVGLYKGKIGSAEILGVHLEGPYISESKSGAQPKSYITIPSIAQFDRWQQLSGFKIKTVTLAPEKDEDGSFIKYLIDQDINVSAGHTEIGFKGMMRAIKMGVNQLTHICNAMTSIHHRDIGAVGAAFLHEGLISELIADGIHVNPEMIELIYKNIGSKRLMLITDSLRAKCLDSGIYDLGGQKVNVNDDQATLSDGTLAGSILKMTDAVKNIVRFTGARIENLIEMTAVNPAKQLGVFDRKGSLKEGKDADILLVDEMLNIQYTICNGEIVYKEK